MKMVPLAILCSLLVTGCTVDSSAPPSLRTKTDVKRFVKLGTTTDELQAYTKITPVLVAPGRFHWILKDGSLWTDFGKSSSGQLIIARVVTDDPPTALTNPSIITDESAPDDLCIALMLFHESPSSERFHSILTVMMKFEKTMPPYDVALTAVWAFRAIQKYNYTYPTTPENNRLLLNIKTFSAQNSDRRKFLDDDSLITPEKLDFWWASFFATGETQYLDKILSVALKPNPGEADKSIGAARWSLASNAKQQRVVKYFLESNQSNTKYDTAIISKCLSPK